MLSKISRLRFVPEQVHNFRTHGTPLIVIERINAQCFHHTGNIRALAGPAGRRLRTVEDMEAYYDEAGFYDYIHKLSRTPILKAQHPDYEIWIWWSLNFTPPSLL